MAEHRDMEIEGACYDPSEREPKYLCEAPHLGDVTDLEVFTVEEYWHLYLDLYKVMFRGASYKSASC